jgi:hypothetical protein
MITALNDANQSYENKSLYSQIKLFVDALKHIGIGWPELDILEKHVSSMVNEDSSEGKTKITLYTDPNYYGAEVDDSVGNGKPVIQVPLSKLVGFEPDQKMTSVTSSANMEKMVELIKTGKGSELPPIFVRQYQGGYQVLDGHHRYHAYKAAGANTIPAKLIPADEIKIVDKAPTNENFADGKGPGRPGDSQRHGIPKGATMAELEKASHAKGRKGQLARWQLNMRRGHKKATNESATSLSTENMIAYLRTHHDENLHSDYLTHLTDTNSQFVLKTVAPASLKTELSGLDREKVERYKKSDFNTAPPIVIGSDSNILDGYHRAVAAKEMNIPTIKAYVGVKAVAEASKTKNMMSPDAKRRAFMGKLAGIIKDSPLGTAETFIRQAYKQQVLDIGDVDQVIKQQEGRVLALLVNNITNISYRSFNPDKIIASLKRIMSDDEWHSTCQDIQTMLQRHKIKILSTITSGIQTAAGIKQARNDLDLLHQLEINWPELNIIQKRINSITTAVNESDDINKASEEEQIKRIYDDWEELQYITDPSPAVQLAAINRSPRAIEYIPHPTPEMQMIAVNQSARAIDYIVNPTNAAMIVALKKKPWIIYDISTNIDSEVWQAIKQEVLHWLTGVAKEENGRYYMSKDAHMVKRKGCPYPEVDILIKRAEAAIGKPQLKEYRLDTELATQFEHKQDIRWLITRLNAMPAAAREQSVTEIWPTISLILKRHRALDMAQLAQFANWLSKNNMDNKGKKLKQAVLVKLYKTAPKVVDRYIAAMKDAGIDWTELDLAVYIPLIWTFPKLLSFKDVQADRTLAQKKAAIIRDLMSKLTDLKNKLQNQTQSIPHLYYYDRRDLELTIRQLQRVVDWPELVLLQKKFNTLTSNQQNESAVLYEYKLDTDQYGGWITPDRKVEYVERQQHEPHVWTQHGATYSQAFQRGFVRFTTSERTGTFGIEGTAEALKKTYRIWAPTAFSMHTVMIDIALYTDSLYKEGMIPSMTYIMPEDKAEVTKVFGPKIQIENLPEYEPAAAEPQGAALTVFDIDETLFHTAAKIHVIKDGKLVDSLDNQQFNNYQLKPGESFDFKQFRDAQLFYDTSKPVKKMWQRAQDTLSQIGKRPGSRVIIVTARSDLDDKETFLDTFRKHGLDIDKMHVHRAGNLPIPAAAAKKAIIGKYLESGKFTEVRLFDDAESNLRSFLELQNDYPNIKFAAYMVLHSGDVRPYTAKKS